jgi:hypothetical protein
MWFCGVLFAVGTSQAQDLHIKKNVSSGGYVISSTETSIKGSRERSVSQTPTGNSVTLRQCDLRRTVNLNEQAQTYYVTPDPQDEATLKAAALASGTAMAESGGYITQTIAVTDTGERKQLFGYTARHMKTTLALESSKNACSPLNQKLEIDGWYADLGKDFACGASLPPVRQAEGCNDRVVTKRAGSAKLGYPIRENLIVHNPDGSTTSIETAVSELSKQKLEPELFDVPKGYREVKSQAELNGGPQPQLAQPQTASVQPAPSPKAQQTAQLQPQNNPQNRPSMPQPSAAAMMNPASAMAMQQGMLAQAQAMGVAGGMGQAATGNPMLQPRPGPQSAAAPAPSQPLGPKAPGKIRIGVAPPEAQVGQGSNNGGDYSTPIRNAEIALMSGPAVEIAALDSHIALQLQAEAQQKQCDYVLYSAVAVKHNQGGGFGKFAKFGGMAASMTPMGAMTKSMAGAAAASAAAQVAAQAAQQQAMNQLAGFNGKIKSKDDVTVQYQLVPTGQTAPITQNSLQGKAKSDGEDVLTPLLTQAATDILTKVSQK